MNMTFNAIFTRRLSEYLLFVVVVLCFEMHQQTTIDKMSFLFVSSVSSATWASAVCVLWLVVWKYRNLCLKNVTSICNSFLFVALNRFLLFLFFYFSFGFFYCLARASWYCRAVWPVFLSFAFNLFCRHSRRRLKKRSNTNESTKHTKRTRERMKNTNRRTKKANQRTKLNERKKWKEKKNINNKPLRRLFFCSCQFFTNFCTNLSYYSLYLRVAMRSDPWTAHRCTMCP